MLTSYKGLHRNNKKQPLAQLLKHGNASQTTLNLKLFKAKMERGNYRMEGSFKNTRAIDTRCFSPPLNFNPRSPTTVLYLSGKFIIVS
jgi:hypothetical protein